MSAPQNLRAIGDRIEHLLEELRASADPRSFDRVEELLRLISDLYGAGFSRVVELAQASAPDMVGVMVGDELVASLLLVHGLHPDALEHRVEAALAKVRPLLAAHGGDVELLEIDADAGAVHLRLLGSCDGCPSSAVTLQSAVETAIMEAAPEIVIIDVDEASKPEPVAVGVPISLTTKPAEYASCPSELAGA